MLLPADAVSARTGTGQLNPAFAVLPCLATNIKRRVTSVRAVTPNF